MKKTGQDGFVGLLVLVIGAAILVYLYVRVYGTPLGPGEGISPSLLPENSTSTTRIGQYEDIISTTKSLQTQMNNYNQQESKMINGQ